MRWLVAPPAAFAGDRTDAIEQVADSPGHGRIGGAAPRGPGFGRRQWGRRRVEATSVRSESVLGPLRFGLKIGGASFVGRPDTINEAGATRRDARSSRMRHGFSLLELIVVLAITTILAGLLFPVLSQVRQRVDIVMSGNNLRTIGFGIAMYERDELGELPRSILQDSGGSPADLTVLFRPEQAEEMVDGLQETGWDGLGRLYGGSYIDAPRTFYAPGHSGDARFEDFEADFHFGTNREIFGNYHYCGHLDWERNRGRRITDPGLVLAADGLRTARDINQRDGLNVLRGDGSVNFIVYPEGVLENLTQPGETPDEVADRYRPIWRALEATRRSSGPSS